ncbi:MAG: shikimate kinase, partial [Phenylobacterium sp.]|nr:shikimate kinase [Phenylobacterium sp.]
DLIKARSVSVWLKTDLPILARRVARKDNRPLLTGKDPMTVLQEQAEVRYPAYGRADITVETGDSPHQVTVDQVVRALTDWQARASA